MAISTWQGVGTRLPWNSAGTSAAPAVTTTNVTPGDLIFAEVGIKYGGVVIVCDDPAWQEVAQVHSGPDSGMTVGLWVFKVPESGIVPQPTFTWGGARQGFAQTFSFQRENLDETETGLEAIGQISTNSGSGSPHTCPGISASAANSLAVYVGGSQSNTVYGPMTSWTERVDSGDTTSAARNVVGHRSLVNAGDPSGDLSITGTTAFWGLIIVEITEPSAPSGPSGVVFEASGQAFTVNGQTSGVQRSYSFPLSPATFAYTPRAANLMRSRRLAADARSFTLTGINAVTAASRRLVADASSFSYSPKTASLLHGFTLSAAPGTISLSSSATDFRRNRALAADPAAYLLINPPVTVVRTRRVEANPAAYVLVSPPASFRRTGGLIADHAAYVLTSPAAFIRRGFQLPAQPGAFALAPRAVAFGQSRRLSAASATYGAVFRDAILLRSRSLQASSAAFQALSPDTRLGQFFRKIAATGSFLLNPQAALLALKRQLLADAATFDLTGAADLRLSPPVVTMPPSARIYTPFFENRIIVFPASGARTYMPHAEDRVIVFPTENRIMLASSQLFTDRVIAP